MKYFIISTIGIFLSLTIGSFASNDSQKADSVAKQLLIEYNTDKNATITSIQENAKEANKKVIDQNASDKEPYKPVVKIMESYMEQDFTDAKDFLNKILDLFNTNVKKIKKSEKKSSKNDDINNKISDLISDLNEAIPLFKSTYSKELLDFANGFGHAYKSEIEKTGTSVSADFLKNRLKTFETNADKSLTDGLSKIEKIIISIDSNIKKLHTASSNGSGSGSNENSSFENNSPENTSDDVHSTNKKSGTEKSKECTGLLCSLGSGLGTILAGVLGVL